MSKDRWSCEAIMIEEIRSDMEIEEHWMEPLFPFHPRPAVLSLALSAAVGVVAPSHGTG